MATITYAVGSSHGPTNRTPPEEWTRLGAGDKNDPRFDFEAHLAKVRPGMETELTLEKRQERGAALLAALASLRESVATADVDVMVVVSNAHRIWPDDSQAVFGVNLWGIRLVDSIFAIAVALSIGRVVSPQTSGSQ